MQKTPPTIDELREVGMKLLESGKEQLKETKNILPVVILGDAASGKGDTVLGISGEVMNSGPQKNALAKKIKELIAEEGYMHSVSLFDTWMLGSTNDEEYRTINALHIGLGMSLDEIAELGLGQLHESLHVIVEAVGTSFMISQRYERDAEGNVVSFGELENGKIGGGRMKFFEES